MRIKILSTLIILLSTVFCGSVAKYSPELQVLLNHGGGVSGHYRTSQSGLGILAFTNIPYAEAPIGDLRFSDPVMKSPWTDYLPSNTSSIECPQKQIVDHEELVSGIEDCLFLNVYVPFGRKQSPTESGFPVMVYIHGGGFTVGSGTVTLLDPSNILDNDVILVTMNYRLGPLGFLSTFEGDLTGNWGMKDQQMALQWVQENIESFNGDKNKVTIFGVSAGGASVALHLMAPKSKGLFQQAIVQSGTPYDPWVMQDKERAIKNAEKLFGLVGCDGKKEDVLMKCLREVKIEDYMATRYAFYEWDADPLVIFSPVLEEEDSPNPFIREVDLKSITDVPLIIGVTTDEGALRTAPINEEKTLIADLEARFDTILPSTLCYSHLEDNQVKQEITEKVRQFYLGEGGQFKWGRDKFAYQNMLTDGLFLAGFDKYLQQRLASQSTSKTYAYLFNYRGTSSFTDILVNSEEEENFGVSHAEDVIYLFPMLEFLAPHRVMSARDVAFGKEFVQLFTDFASFGDPSQGDLQWNAASAGNFEYLRIGNCNREICPQNQEMKSQMLQVLFTERMKFWREIDQIRSGGSSKE